MKPRAGHAFLKALLAALPDSPDPDRALVSLHRFAEARFGPAALDKIATLPAPALGLLLRVFGASPFLAGQLVHHPDWLDWLVADRELGQPRTVKGCAAQLAETVRGLDGHAPRRRAAIRAMRRELLRLSVRRLMGLADEMEMARELSDLAQATLQLGLEEVTPPLAARFGWPAEEMAADSLVPQRRAGFAVIAMGKLGGRELNFSSDIDLIFIYSDEGETSGAPDGAGRITNHAFFTRLAEALVAWLMQPGDEGYFYRVDTRLRPDGETGPLARSLGSCEIYYTTQARLWERLALLKARTVAGDGRLGQAFEAMSRPLVFDPLHSSELVLQIADLKQRIDVEIRRKAGADRELKRGAGGIREIEFLVQTLQMLHGASNSRLWTPETPEAIRQLALAGILPADQARQMGEDYVWLRTIEHRLQMAHLRQTHTLPEDPEALDTLARAAGDAPPPSTPSISSMPSMSPGQQLLARWAEISRRVHHDFREFFERSARAAQRAEAELTGGRPRATDDDGALEAATLILSSQPEGAALPQLAPWGIAGGGALKVLRRLGGMGRTMYLTVEGGLAYKQLLPVILRLLRRNPQPEKALAGLESFLYASGAIAGYYTTFLRNSRVFELLLLAFGSGAMLAQTLIAHPEFLDIIADPRAMSADEDRSETMRRMLDQWTGGAERQRINERMTQSLECGSLLPLSPADHPPSRPDVPLPDFCRALARLKRLEFLLAGLGELSGLLDYSASCDRLNTMAAVVIEQALGRAARELGLDPPPPGFAVLALGKLGAGELNYYSDLDLIFVWDDAFAAGRPAPGEAAAALANRTIEILTHPTPEGAPFAVDTRLRPEGQNAPLAPPLARYLEYYASGRAQTWEIQSAMKLRPVAGDGALARRLARELGAVIAEKVRGLDLGGEIRAMRRRMEAAVKTARWIHCDFKSGPGGTVDLEFIAQYLQLTHLAADPGLLGLGPLRVFARLAAVLGARASSSAPLAEQLIEDYIWLRRLERRARLLFESDKSLLPAAGEKLAALERACEGLVRERGEATLSEAVDKVLRRNRRHFEEIVV